MWYIGSFFFRLAALPTNWDTRLDLFTNSPDQIETSISSLSMEISFPARKTTLKNIPTKKFTPIIWRMTSDLWCITATRFGWILFVTRVLIFYLKVLVDKKKNRLHLIISGIFKRRGIEDYCSTWHFCTVLDGSASGTEFPGRETGKRGLPV